VDKLVALYSHKRKKKMLFNTPIKSCSPIRQKIRDFYREDENKVLEVLMPLAETGVKLRSRIWENARQLIVKIRKDQAGKGGVDALLQEFSISSEEGVVLMCLAEALLRVPDKITSDELIRDKLSGGDWVSHIGQSDSMFVNASSWGLLLTGKLVDYRKKDRNIARKSDQKNQYGIMKKMVGRMGEPVIRKAVRQSMELMGSQFVMGVDIQKALRRAAPMEKKGYTYSYDMLGEGARTMLDAERYFKSYLDAIEAIGEASQGKSYVESPGISVKLSAIHPRYEFTHKHRVMNELVPRLKSLALAAKKHDIGFTVDAEEAERLDLSLDVIEQVFSDPELEGWNGFGMAVQAYQKRAIYVIEWIRELTQSVQRTMMVRLVKGAYWDSEIKNSQAEGFDDFPVFTRKASTDVSYQACAKKLLSYRDSIFPQFASHNAYTVSTILQMDTETQYFKKSNNCHHGFEFQRLHGMGESLFDQIVNNKNIPCRVYAPVGAHVDLLAYLVRRLLENGANSSFVNNIVDENISVESLLVDPLETVSTWKEKKNGLIASPRNLYGESRVNSSGIDLTDVNRLQPLKVNLDLWVEANFKSSARNTADNLLQVINPANVSEIFAYLQKDDESAMKNKLQRSQAAFDSWSKLAVKERAKILYTTADLLEKNIDELMAICIKEAGKTPQDSVAEVREAVDFCRYYAMQAEKIMQDNTLKPLGVVLCISPWNFPLAIFLGQVSAAIVCGNTVMAKPAEQTSFIAIRAIELMMECGLPEDVVSIVKARGSQVGQTLIPDDRVKAVMFTGSTDIGSWIAKTLAKRGGEPVPLVAETGGQNCMIIDSTALPEQVVDDVITSGFQSAGQRCSALRVLFLQDGIADKVIDMLRGAMGELKIGDPAFLDTDVGPVIDQKALASLQQHADYMITKGKLLHICELDESLENKGTFFAPRLYEISHLSILQKEVFGPCVHIIRFKSEELEDVMTQIADTKFGLTMGIHSRIDEKCSYLAERSPAGNVYVNRNMIGAIVGAQPFGGRGLSGTGPKAGGPHYLSRLLKSENNKEIQLLTESQLDGKRRLADEVLNDETKCKLSNLQHGFSQWRYHSLTQRVSVIRQLLANLSISEQFLFSLSSPEDTMLTIRQHLLKIENELALPISLPGPTGESNQLFFEPRGLLLSLLDEPSSKENWFINIILAIAAGNTLLVIFENDKQKKLAQIIEKAFSELVPNQAIVKTASINYLNNLLAENNLSGALVDQNSDWLSYVTQTISERVGEILPVIHETRVERLYSRLTTEKTISIDTTAAGGNASLMTMNEAEI